MVGGHPKKTTHTRERMDNRQWPQSGVPPLPMLSALL